MWEQPHVLVIKPSYNSYSLGLAYVLTCLEKENVEIDFIDLFFRKEEDIIQACRDKQYDIVFSGGLTFDYSELKRIFGMVRYILPNALLVAGGNIANDVSPELLFQSMHLNYLLRGEGETNISSFMHMVQGIASEQSVHGLIYKHCEDGKIIKIPTIRFNLTQTNILPAWHYFDMERCTYEKLERQHLFPILTGRGCAYLCAFCSPTIGHFMARPVDHVIQEMEYFADKYSIDVFFLLNETAFLSEEHLVNFCIRYKSSNVHQTPWISVLRTDSPISQDTFDLMYEAGCKSVRVGFESGSDRVLEVMKKKNCVSTHRQFAENCRKTGIRCWPSFIYLNYDETEQEMHQTTNLIIQTDTTLLPITFPPILMTYPGTANYRRAFKRGLITDEEEAIKFISYANLEKLDLSNAEILNLSKLSNDNCLSVVRSECERYFKYLRNSHTVPCNPSRQDHVGYGRSVDLIAFCKNCHSQMIHNRRWGQVARIIFFCPSCFHYYLGNVLESPRHREHFEDLQRKLHMFDRILVLGVGHYALDYIIGRPERLAIDDRISAFMAIYPSHFYDKASLWRYRCVNRHSVRSVEYDAILSLNVPEDELTDAFFQNHNLNADIEILSWVPANNSLQPDLAYSEKRVCLLGDSDDVQLAENILRRWNHTASLARFTSREMVNLSNWDYVVVPDSIREGMCCHGDTCKFVDPHDILHGGYFFSGNIQ